MITAGSITTIYKLVVDDKCEYVGKTRNPEVRAKAHLCRMQGAKFVVIEAVPHSRSQKAEKKWIQFYRSIGQAKRNIHFVKRPSRTSFIYVRSDLHNALRVRAIVEKKKLYQLCEELLAPHIETFRASRLPNGEVLQNEEAKR